MTQRRTPVGRPFQPGQDARRNTRSAGRPPDEWKRALAQLVTRDSTLTHVKTVLDTGPDHPQFFKALAYATDHGVGRPTQQVDVTSGGKPLTVVTGVPEPDVPWPPPRPTQEAGA